MAFPFISFKTPGRALLPAIRPEGRMAKQAVAITFPGKKSELMDVRENDGEMSTLMEPGRWGRGHARSRVHPS